VLCGSSLPLPLANLADEFAGDLKSDESIGKIETNIFRIALVTLNKLSLFGVQSFRIIDNRRLFPQHSKFLLDNPLLTNKVPLL